MSEFEKTFEEFGGRLSQRDEREETMNKSEIIKPQLKQK